MADKHPTWELFYAIERDLRAGLAKLSELGVQLSQLDLPDAHGARCPVCGIATKGSRTLEQHIYYAHDGPVPESWESLDALVV